MRIENLEIKIIEKFSQGYILALFQFGKKALETPNGKKTVKIRKEIEQSCLREKALTAAPQFERVLTYLSDLNDVDYIAFFKSCYEYIEEHGSSLQQRINEIGKNLSDEVREALVRFLENESYDKSDFKRVGNDLEITFDSSVAYEEKLILSNAEIVPDKGFDSLFFWELGTVLEENSPFMQENGVYKLIAKDEKDQTVTISFIDASRELQSVNPMKSGLHILPWEQMVMLCVTILEKADKGALLNKEECTLLPLMREIVALFTSNPLLQETAFPRFKVLIEKHCFPTLLAWVEKIELPHIKEKKRECLKRELFRQLNFATYQPLWQEIYDRIDESQKDYPTRVEAIKAKATITRLKNKVNELMQEHGYSGTYPDFYKRGVTKGVRFIGSYHASYIGLFEKNTVYRIYCNEACDSENRLFVTFLYGAEFLKPNESHSNINTCRFHNKGRKQVNSLLFVADEGDGAALPLEKRIEIAVKSAENKKLTKEERAQILSFQPSLLGQIASVFRVWFIAGFFFAAIGIPAMIGVFSLIAWLDGIPNVIDGVPWVEMFFMAWIGFGTGCGLLSSIVAILGRKRGC